MADEVTLTIGGQVFAGWTDVEVANGIDAVAGSFRLGVTERWQGQPQRWAIEAGTAARIAIGGQTVISGFIDHLDSHLDGSRHSIEVSGRSRAADLVDCSAINVPGSWANQSLETIAAAIAAPFGVTIVTEAPAGAPFGKFALQQGETAWDAIERMLRQRGLLGFSGADGTIRLVSPKPGAASVTLTQGRDILSLSGAHEVSERFSRYTAKGQAAGSDHASGAAVAGPSGSAEDAGVGRYRPLIVIAEDQATPASLAARAQWEASVRAAKAQTARVTLVGWRQPGGALWQPMQYVHLVAPAAWIDAVLMVVSVTHRLAEDGRRTELLLARPEAYTQMAMPADARPSSIFKQRDTARLGRRR